MWRCFKMRYYVTTSTLVKYYQSNIKPLIQYGLLVYGCTSFYSLKSIHMIQIIRMIYFKRKYDIIPKFFFENKKLRVHELYIYELTNFGSRSLNRSQSTYFLNYVFFEKLCIQYQEFKISKICSTIL